LNTTYLVSLLQHYGYPFLWLIVFVAAAGAPISGSLLLSAAGAFAAYGDLNIFILFPLAVSAAVMGDNLTYWIGRRLGLPLLGWLERQKRFKWISPRAVERARENFKKHTGWTIFLTRFLIVVLGGAINLLSGIEQYPYPNFLFWDISGQILSALISLGLGYAFAASWEEVAGVFGAFSGLVLAVLATGILAVFFVRWLRQERQASARSAANTANTAGNTDINKDISDTSDTSDTSGSEPETTGSPPQKDTIQLQQQKKGRPTNPLPISD
jgi:membrane-associated protein